MSKRKVKDAKDLETDELIYFKGHAKATYMSDGRSVEEAINQACTGGGGGGITTETDPIFMTSPAAKIKDDNITSWNNKVDKVNGKQLSTENFTTLLKQKLEGLSNYDDTEISQAISKLRTDLDTLVSGDTTTAIKTFNEVIAFLDGITDSQNLESIIASIEQQIASKQDKITDLETIRSGAAKGATALQSYTEQYTGTYSKPSGGIPKTDLASTVQESLSKADTAIQTHQDISGKADKSSLAAVATSGSYNDLSNKPTIPSAVTESTVSGWGFTKNIGTYSKPSSGIPKSDLNSAVQTSLDKADTALQEHQDISNKINGNGTITKIVKVSALPDNPDANTLYIIV